MKHPLAHSAFALALLHATPAAAQANAAVNRSVQCFLAANLLVGNKDSNTKTTGVMATTFYAGQIFGASPKLNVAAAFQREAAAMKTKDIKALLTRCLDEMKARSAQIAAAGKALRASIPPPKATP